MLQIIPRNLNIDFVGKRHIWTGVSIVAMIASLVLIFTKGLNFGVDFTGGAEVQLQFKTEMSVGDLRSMMDAGGFKSTRIQQLGDEASREFLVRFQGDESDLQQISTRVSAALAAKIQTSNFEIQRVDVVGPQAGSELRKSGMLSMVYALICILIYIAIRFDTRYAPGAIVALFHDVLVTVGVFVIVQKEFSLQIVAALLTIIGYSINDTIVIFDRIRETLRNYPNRPLLENINRSINETLGRTILTTFSTLLVVVALMLFAGGIIRDFAFALFVGMVLGTYSTVFVATTTMIWMAERQDKQARLKGLSGKPVSKPI